MDSTSSHYPPYDSEVVSGLGGLASGLGLGVSGGRLGSVLLQATHTTGAINGKLTVRQSLLLIYPFHLLPPPPYPLSPYEGATYEQIIVEIFARIHPKCPL